MRLDRTLLVTGALASGCLLPEWQVVDGVGSGGSGGTSSAGSNATGGGGSSGSDSAGAGGAGCSAEHRCTDGELQACDAENGWQLVKHCVIDTCDAELGECTEGCTPDGSDCDSGICLSTGKCEPPLLTLSGFVQRSDSLSLVFEEDVDVTATNLLPGQPTSTSDATGAYNITGVPPATLLDLEVTWDNQTALVFIPPALRRTQFALRAEVATPADGTTVRANAPAVLFMWLAQVAVDCGVFASVEEATGADQNPAAINPFWIQRSTLVAEVNDAEGMPVSGIQKEDIEVILGGFSNKNVGANDANLNPARVCFLEPDDTDPSDLVGSTRSTSSAAGRFVMFRLRNEEHGTGDGIAELRVLGYPPATVSLKSSGNIGFVRINGGAYQVPAPRDRSFEADVLPILANYGCVGCHTPPDGPGYLDSVPRGADEILANYTGTADEVYEVLTAADDADCTDPLTPQRVCVAAPQLSLLAKKPLRELDIQDHPTTAFGNDQDADYRAIVEWIEQGAER